MNKYLHTLLIVISIFFAFVSKAENGDVKEPEIVGKEGAFLITYRDNFAPNSQMKEKVSLEDSHNNQKRVPSNGLQIQLSEDSNIPWEVRSCFIGAANLWKRALNDSCIVRIKVSFDDSPDDDIVTQVSYINVGNMIVPSALNDPEDENSKYQGIININSEAEWDYSFFNNPCIDKRNLTFALARAIGRVLGLGSSLKINDEGAYASSHGRLYSNYDNLIKRDDNTSLTSIKIKGYKGNENYKNFIEAENAAFYLTDGYKAIKLSNGPYSLEYPPLSNLTDGLMAPEIGVGDYYLRIDDELLDVMEMLGWTTRERQNIQIICDEMDQNGSVSPYRSHTFYLNKDIPGTVNSRWHVNIPCVDQIFDANLNDDNQTCWVPKLSELAINYSPITNSNGIACGNIEYKYFKNAIPLKTQPLNINFDYKPRIFKVNIKGVEYDEDFNWYHAIYEVEYGGNSYINVTMKGEYDPIIYTQKIEQPEIASGVTTGVFVEDYGWLTIEVSNKYGKDSITYEFEPYGLNWYPIEDQPIHEMETQQASLLIPSEVEYSTHYAYDLQGTLLWEGHNLRELNDIGHVGMIILKSVSGRKIQTKKIILK